ncbi:hypothetical protein KIN20_018667 [Parelaphostrongylus tenuis]|uniref:Myosin light chain kinase n=1 Tax=Parelaphostrongylus tenuis TaxID=148309 RepID=A0AAD5N7S6_PARTN|nr:hypothetical protein KIN20_018667 [Parelaphostrongylus tenuis]
MLVITPTLGRPTSVPPIPRIFITSTDSVRLEWDIADEETSAEYTVSYKSEKSSIWTEVNCSVNSCSIDGLKEGVSYVFKVAARNEAGVGTFSEETPPIKLIPNVPPVITKPIKDATIPKKRTLKFECHANGEPAPEYIWYKDGKEIIPQNANTEIVNEGYMSMLIIHSVDYSDAGSYTCEVVNDHGVMKSTANVNVTDVRCHFESSFSEYTEIIEGKDIELCCVLSDEDGVVSWYKDGKILSDSDRIEIVADYNKRILKISTVNSTDSGTYRCETSDGRSRTEGELLVKEEEPHISIGPQDDIIKHFGSEVVLKCELTKPPHKVLWYKNGNEVWPQTNKYTMTTEGCSSFLTIQNFDKNDIGEYCAALSQSEVSAPAHLRLEVIPEIRIEEQITDEVILNAHDELAFHVEVSAFPVPSITIMHNEIRIQNRASVEQYDDVVSVRMKNLTRDDCGVVKIIVENSAGRTQKDIRLTVLDVPSEPMDLRASNTTANSTILSWKYPENTNGAPVTGFIVERKAVDSNRWRSIGKTNASTLTFAAADLLNKQVYGFRVIAVNSVGEGPPSQPVDVVTLDDEWKDEFTEDLPPISPVLDVPDISIIDDDKDRMAQLIADGENSFILHDDSSDSVKLVVAPPVLGGADISVAEDGEIDKPQPVIDGENGYIPSDESTESRKIDEPAISIEETPAQKKADEKKVAKKSKQKKKEKITVEETKIDEQEKRQSVKEEKSEQEQTMEKKTKDTHIQPEIVDEIKKESDLISAVSIQPEPDKKGEIKKDIDLKETELVLKPKSESVELMFGKSGEVIVSSSVEAQFNWTKEGRSLDEGYHVKDTKTQTMVQIPSATFETAGIYKCVATDTRGNTATTSITVSIRGKPIVEVETDLVEVKAGESAKLFANVRGTSEVKCSWKKDEKLIKTSKNMSTSYKDGAAQLTIKEVDASNTGVYTLLAKNKDGEDSANIKLIVKSIPEVPQGPLDVTIGGKTCSLSWKPPLNDGNCPILGYYIEKYDEKTKKWTFVARSTNANYKTESGSSCRFRVAAENAVGLGPFIESKAIPTESPPQISRSDGSTPTFVFTEGEAAELSFSFTGQPAPVVEWTDNTGKPISESKMFKIECTAQGTKLSMKSISVTESGVYKLKVKNRCGEDSISINVQVNGRPSPPGRPIVKEQMVDSLLLSWTPPKLDGGSPVKQYTIEMCTTAIKKWKMAEKTKQTYLKLHNLIAKETYTFRVRAENASGQSEPSEESEPVLITVPSPVADEKKREVDEEQRKVDEQKQDKIDEKKQEKLDEKKQKKVDEKKQKKVTGKKEKVDEEIDLKAADKSDAKDDQLDQKRTDVHSLANDFETKYTICEELGQGAYGTVYRAIEKATGKTWAAKMVQVRPGVKREDVLHEISVMSQLHHDKLLELHEAFDLGHEICLIVEFVSGGELFDKMMESGLLISEEEARDYVRQILLGIEHMHSNQFVHLDLKPENILLKSKESADVKIVDFGLARRLDPSKTVRLLFGTPEFCAPEVVNREPVGLSTDMWTIGVISYMLLSGLSPFIGDSEEETLANVSAANWDFDDSLWDDVSDTAKDFIRRLMVKDKRRRMTVQQALKHPWISKTQPHLVRAELTPLQKKRFMMMKRWSDDMLPIGRLAKHGAIFRRQSMDGVFERNISFDSDCPPTVKKQLEDIIAHVGDLIATMTCEINGMPAPIITWLRDNEELNVPSLKYDSLFSDGSAQLTVKNIEETDSGKYSCHATNELGSVTTEANMRVEARPKMAKADLHKKKPSKATADDLKKGGTAPVFVGGLSNCSVKLGEDLSLSVTSSASDLTVEWYHNGQQIHDIEGHFVQIHNKDRHDLTVKNATLSDQGEWKAVGKNAFGQCESSCDLVVQVPRDYMAPVFERRLEDILCSETELLTLNVKITANPPPEITWYRDDHEIQHSAQYRIQFDDDTLEYSLTIVKAYAEDSGEYKCIAKNLIGEAESVCTVRIEEPEDNRTKAIDESKAPKFSMRLIDSHEVVEGSELVLTCIVNGSPHPTITWLKDGKRLSITGKDATYENGVCTLTIAATTSDDHGVYTCKAENTHGIAQSTCTVHITSDVESDQSAPEFVELLMDQSFHEEEEILLECRFTAKPAPTVYWYKDGQKLLVENRMLQYTDRTGVARLNIMNSIATDSGEYSCEAVNILGKAVTECRIKIIGQAMESESQNLCRSVSPSHYDSDASAPEIIRPLLDATVKTGSRQALELEVEGMPTPMVEWFHDGTLVSESRTVRTSYNGRVAVLKIYEAQAEHQGQYICKVSNKLGVVESRAMLVVEPESTERMSDVPVFIKKLQDITVKKVGESLSMSCQIRGDPFPVIRWLHDGQSIENNSAYRSRVFDDGIATLEISSMSEELCGAYTIIASNPSGEAHSSAMVQLLKEEDTSTRPPTFVVEPKSKIVVSKSSPLIIVCDIQGSPSMTVTWLKDKHQLKATDRIREEHDGLTYRLIVLDTIVDDEGVYTVRVEDEYGKIEACSQVIIKEEEATVVKTSVKIVKGPPGALEGKLHVENCSTDSVSLIWNNVTDASEYLVEQRTPDQQNWIEAATTSRPKCVIKNLQPNTEYLFSVIPKNTYGCGERSSTVLVKTKPVGFKPHFIEVPPSSLCVMNEHPVEIAAKFEGMPIPRVKWYKNNKEILESESKITTDKNITTLSIAAARHGEDDAVYLCHIENELGEIFAETTVIVTVDKEEFMEIDSTSDSTDRILAAAGAPFVAKPLTNVTVQSEQQFTLSCKIAAKDCAVAWYRNNERISSTGRYEIFSSSNGLQKLICHISCLEDSGVYRCVVTNEKGIAQSECEVTIKDVCDQVAPAFDRQLADITALIGKSAVLSCRAVGQPEPELTWIKDGERLTTSRRVKLVFDEQGMSELRIRDLTAQDAGIYLCSATNPAGVQSTQCTLTVVEVAGEDSHLILAGEAKAVKPRFIRAPPSTIDAQEGGQFKLIAKAVGDPRPIITWKKDGREVQRTNRLYKTYVTGDGESHLLVECVVSKTSGIFSCIAHNVHGEAEAETQVIVHKGVTAAPAAEKPDFSQHLKDLGVVTGHPVTLSCKVRGVPEPELKWFYINDDGKVTCLTDDEHGWIECRGGEAAELKADCVLRNQQGTYKCVATNEHGQASSQCYLLVGELQDEPAGPPRFLRCLRDIWTPLDEEVVFEVEVAGYPAPDLIWYHQDKRIVEGKSIKINYISETFCELRVSHVSLRDLGNYAVEASNVHGLVRTTCSLNAGEPRCSEPPQFQLVDAPEIAVQPKVAFREQMKKSASTVRRKGAPPVFVQGLEDMELEAGSSAAVAGKLARKVRHRHSEHKPLKRARLEAREFAAAIAAGMSADEQSQRQSTEDQKPELIAMEEIRSAIQLRNEHMCRPKFMVKPKPKKTLEEFKSLRLKTAISANPTPTVYWDRDGVVLETGNKYSIYNDGDFYYLEVHHVSTFDQGFYNCTATNSEGIATCSSEVEVVKPAEDALVQQEKRKHKREPRAPAFVEVLPGKMKTKIGDSLSVECSVSGYPAPAIKWLRNGTPLLPHTQRCVMSYDGECATLKFAFLSAADEGIYVCEARNECGEVKAQMLLEVEGADSATTAGIPPLFRTEKIRQVFKANDGERVQLSAEIVQGSEPLQIRWIRNRVTITDSQSFQYRRQGPDVTLVIADAFPEDSGEYAVEARNQWGTARCIMRLDVHSHERSLAEEAPRISNVSTVVKVAAGEEAELNAHVTGHPDPVIAWTKERKPITNSEKFTLSNDGNSFTLRVKDVVRTDAGKYSLTAVNVAGEAHATFELMVTEPTSTSTMRPRFTHTHSVRAVSSWTTSRVTGSFCRHTTGDLSLVQG